MDKEKIINAIGLELYEYLRTANHDEGEYKDLKPESKETLCKMGELALQALCKELPDIPFKEIQQNSFGMSYIATTNGDTLYQQLKSWGKDD